MGLALCLTVAAQEKAKLRMCRDMLWQLTMRSTRSKRVRKHLQIKTLGGDSICSSSSPKSRLSYYGDSQHCWNRYAFTVRNTKIAKEYSANSTVVLECIGLDNTSPFNIIFDFGDSAEDFCYPWSFTLKASDMMVTASFRDKDGIKLVSEDPDYKEVFKVLQAKYKEHYNIK